MLIELFVTSAEDGVELETGILQLITPEFTEEFQSWLNIKGFSLPEGEAYVVCTHSFIAEHPITVAVFSNNSTHWTYEMSVKDLTTFLALIY